MCKTAALLLSRQKLAPCGRSPWIKRTVDALNYFRQENLTLLSSVGTLNWELPLCAASLENIRTIVVVYTSDSDSFQKKKEMTISDFNLKNSSFIHLPYSENEKTSMKLRDEYILTATDRLFPVSVRSGGSMDNFLKTPEIRDKVENRFLLSPEKSSRSSFYYTFSGMDNDDPVLESTDYIIHWTRTSLHPWPDERRFDFYRDVILSNTYPRTAFHTLLNILSKKMILGSNRHMPKEIQAVCFSGHAPKRFLHQMRWRRRYVQMSFEPYGIGVERKTAEEAGIRPVIYADSKELRKMNSPERWIYQSEGKSGDWSEENEFRFRGSFSLKDIKPDKLVAFCLYPYESLQIKDLYGIEAVSFYKFNPESMPGAHRLS
ncbi:MAG: hypothetical protein ACLFVQ_08960 [Chitinispirillaceae bacterium]